MPPAETLDSRRAPQPTPRLRLLLFSELLLDRPYEWATSSIADARRAAARESLVEILGAARNHHADAIVCAGNLFDRRTVAPATTQWLMAALRSVGVPVFITPGGRDFVGPLGGYSNHQWPENVTVFRSDRSFRWSSLRASPSGEPPTPKPIKRGPFSTAAKSTEAD